MTPKFLPIRLTLLLVLLTAVALRAAPAPLFNGQSLAGWEGDLKWWRVQDGALTGSINNANMQTGADGTPPRMQMFLWNGKSSASIKLSPQNASPVAGVAAFGPSSFAVTAPVAIAANVDRRGFGCGDPAHRNPW